ncbi:MAG: hypothetical protein ACRDLV_08215 [Solirubrobacteraceae bacterium]
MSAPADHIDYGQVQALPGMGPAIGDVWANRARGELYTIVKIRQSRRCWVTIRGVGDEREVLLANLERYYTVAERRP